MAQSDTERNPGFSDVTLIAEGREFKVNKNVLSAASPYFEVMFSINMKERQQEYVCLQELSGRAMEIVLDYVYTGRMHALNSSNVYDVIASANYLLLTRLKSQACEFLQQKLDVSNCIETYYFAKKYECKELLHSARKFINTNFISVSETETFLALNHDQVKDWISSDDIVIRAERDVIKVVRKWVEDGESSEGRDNNFPELLRCMRLPNENQRKCFEVHALVLTALPDETPVCLYIPESDGWFHLPTTSNNENYRGACCTGGSLFLVSGTSADRYDPSVNRWSAIADPPAKTKNMAIVALAGHVYIIGGITKSQLVDNVFQYNPNSNSWQKMASLSSPRTRVCAVAHEKYIYAIGGRTENGSLNTVEKFDRKSNVWTPLAPMTGYRSGACGSSLKDSIFVIGGMEVSGQNPTVLKTCELYSCSANQWQVIASMRVPRFSASACTFGGAIYVFGGAHRVLFGSEREGLDCDLTTTFEVYHPHRNEWEDKGNMPILSVAEACCMRLRKTVFQSLTPLRALRTNPAQ